MTFNLKEALKNYPAPEFFKAGLIIFIEKRKISVKSEKDLDKIVNDYKKLKIGD